MPDRVVSEILVSQDCTRHSLISGSGLNSFADIWPFNGKNFEAFDLLHYFARNPL